MAAGHRRSGPVATPKLYPDSPFAPQGNPRMPPSGLSTLAPRMPSRAPITTAAAAALAALTLAAPRAAAQPATTSRQALPGPDLAFRGDPPASAGRKPISRGKLQRKLKKLARKAPGSSGYYVTRIGGKSDAAIFDRNGGHTRKLASNEKLFTTTTALHRLGPKGRIETKVKAGGKVAKGKLKGDIYLVGGGDPSFDGTGVVRSRRAGPQGRDPSDRRPGDRRRQRLRPPPRRARLRLGPEPVHRPAQRARLRRLDLRRRPGQGGGEGVPRRPARRRRAGSAARSRSAASRRRSAAATRSPTTSRRRSRRSSAPRTRTRSTSTPRCC